MTGQTISHYEVLEKLGEGGMGVVYKARDVQLGRFVALKKLRPQESTESERKRRFIQEAKSASALNHPNIITVYEIVNHEGADFIAMEFVRGATIETLIGRKGLPLRETLELSTQIADALAAAHSAGIIHRDVKPSNVMVTEAGLVKVLDFGVAKLTEPTSDETAETRTLGDESVTEEGKIVGTAAYMSPEQAEGRPLDARSDVFSFGALLYELTTGRRAFHRETKLSTLSAILREEPKPVSEISADAPRELERIIARCLRKDPRRRFQHMDDVKVALQELKEESESGKLLPATPATRATHWKLWAGAAALAAGLAAAAFLWRTESTRPAQEPQLRRMTHDSGLTGEPALSPDGKLLAFASDRSGEGNLDIWVQQVAGGQAIRLTKHEADDHEPAFSADGSSIAFRSEREGGGLYMIATLGSEERLIAKGASGARWSPDGKWLAFQVGTMLGPSKILLMPANGGPAKELRTDVAWVGNPLWSPDGKHLLFLGDMKPHGGIPNEVDDWCIVPVEGGTAAKTGVISILRRQQIFVRRPSAWIGNRILFAAGDGTLRRIEISPRNWRAVGAAERVTIGTGFETDPVASAGGDIAFGSGSVTSEIWRLPIDANQGRIVGNLQRLTEDAADDFSPHLSADGRKMVFSSTRSGNRDLWIRDMSTGRDRSLVATPAWEMRGRISPDGSRVVFESADGEARSVHLVAAEGGTAEKLCDDGGLMDFASDGRRVVCALMPARGFDSIDVVTRQRIEILRHPKYPLHRAAFSPDNQWLTMNVPAEPGKYSPVIVTRLRDGKASSNEKDWIVISNQGGTDRHPWWSPDGNLLYFISARDGFDCFYARRLDPATKQGLGPVFSVYHFHGARRSIRPQAGYLGPSLLKDQLIFSMTEITGNVWMTKLP